MLKKSIYFLDRQKFQIIHRNGEPDKNMLTADLMNKGMIVEENLIDVLFTNNICINNVLDKKHPPRLAIEC